MNGPKEPYSALDPEFGPDSEAASAQLSGDLARVRAGEGPCGAWLDKLAPLWGLERSTGESDVTFRTRIAAKIAAPPPDLEAIRLQQPLAKLRDGVVELTDSGYLFADEYGIENLAELFATGGHDAILEAIHVALGWSATPSAEDIEQGDDLAEKLEAAVAPHLTDDMAIWIGVQDRKTGHTVSTMISNLAPPQVVPWLRAVALQLEHDAEFGKGASS